MFCIHRVQATSDDRSTTAVTTGHQRRNSVTSRLHSTPSLSSLSRGACDIVAQAPGRVLNGIAEDESHDCSCCDEHDADVSSRDIAGGNWPRAAAITASPDVSVTPPTTDPVANCAPKTCSMGADMGTRRGSGIYDELPVLAALRSTMTARRNAVVTSDIGSYPIEVADDDQSQTATVTTAVARRRSSVSFYIPTETTTSGDEIDPLQVPKITHSCSSAEVETKTAASTVPSHVNRPLRVAAGPSPMRSGAPYCQHDNIAVAFRPASAAVPLRSASFSGALPAVRKLSQPSFTSSRLISAGPLPATTVSRPSSSSSSDAECGDGGSLRVTKPSATTAPRPSVSSTVSSTGRRRSLLIRINDNKAVRMTIIVVGAFLACWIPVSVAYLMRVVAADSSSVSNLVWDAVVLVSYAASTIDPLIYNFYSAEFRRAARRVLSCGQHKSGVLIA
jgi:hypothetical protein